MTADRMNEVRDRASRQYGLFRTEHADELGVGPAQRRNELAHGRIALVCPGLYEIAGTPHTTGWEGMASVLATAQPGTVSHLSAAAWWGLPGRPLRPWNVIRQRGVHGAILDGVVAHEPRSVTSGHVVLLRNLPVTTPARTVFDLAATMSPDVTESALDAFWSRGLLNHAQLATMLDEIGGRGRSGTVLMRELTEARENVAFLPTESGLELRFAKILQQAGMAPLDRQAPIADGAGWIGRFDFVDRRRRIVVEVQSDRYHSALSDQRRDAKRRSKLEADGWLVIEVWDTEVWHYPDTVVQKIGSARIASRQSRAA